MKISIAQLMRDSQVKFGTSGARGLVSDMTERVCYGYTLGFIQYLEKTQQLPTRGQKNRKIALAGDLRESSAQILNACARAIIDSGCQLVYCARIATPAVALYGLSYQCPAIMVTGSHIPDDRNGIKFYKLAGEILKQDEAAIKAQEINLPDTMFAANGSFKQQNNYLDKIDSSALDDYRSRYLQLFPGKALTGKKIGVYQQSSVIRDLLPQLLRSMGAQVVELARSERFIPVDTEAVRPQDIELAKQWSEEYQLDAIVSTDGDADRPLIADENGHWMRGDIIGFMCAQYLQIDHLVTPISSNSSVEKSGFFVDVKRTRIGSPYVIAAMNHYVEDHYAAVAGYEANGGFLLATPVRINGYLLSPLPTRDALIVLLSLLHSSVQNKLSLAQLSSQLPQRYTYSACVKDFSAQKSRQILAHFSQADDRQNKAVIEADLAALGKVKQTNTLDGLRITFSNDNIIHFRPSGNAPEFRCYSEADSLAEAEKINNIALQVVLAH